MPQSIQSSNLLCFFVFNFLFIFFAKSPNFFLIKVEHLIFFPDLGSECSLSPNQFLLVLEGVGAGLTEMFVEFDFGCRANSISSATKHLMKKNIVLLH